MSNFTINGVYSYTRSSLYNYLGMVPANARELKEAFNEYGVRITGSNEDLKRLKSAMYQEYSAQVQQQINNQNEQKTQVPWAGLLAQIGLQATGEYNTDYANFQNAINLLSQSAIDGQAMAYFAGLRSEAKLVFSSDMSPAQQENLTFYAYQYQHLS